MLIPLLNGLQRMHRIDEMFALPMFAAPAFHKRETQIA
jgi:hypothetical protein